MKKNFLFAAVAALAIFSTSAAFAAESSFKDLGIEPGIPTQHWAVGGPSHQSDGSYTFMMTDKVGYTYFSGIVVPVGWSGIPNLDAFVAKYGIDPDYARDGTTNLPYKVVKDSVQTRPISFGSGTGTLLTQQLDINHGHIRNVAVFYGQSKKGWFIFFLGNANPDGQHDKPADLTSDIKAVAAGLKIE